MRNTVNILLIPLLIALWATSAVAATANSPTGFFFDGANQSEHRLAIGARYHDKAPSVTDRGLSREDLSWRLAYEYHEEIAFWQIALGYATESNTDKDVKVLTPELNLIFKDGIYRLGAGALMSRVSGTDSEWTDLYWQAIAGVSIPLGWKLSVDIYGHWVFHKWDEIAEGSDNAAELSLMLGFTF